MSGTLPALGLQEQFLPRLDAAVSLLHSATNNLVYFFAIVSFVLLGLRYASATESHMDSLKWVVPQLATMIGIVWLSNNLTLFATIIHSSLTVLGIRVAGLPDPLARADAAQMIFDIGLKTFSVMAKSCGTFGWLNPLNIVGAALGGLLILLSSLALYLYTLIKIYHFKVVIIVGCVMVPPGLWPRTAGIAEDWITRILNASLAMFMLMVCVSLPLSQFASGFNNYTYSCSLDSFVWIGALFATWTVITFSLTQTFGSMISKGIKLYGAA